MKIPVHLSEKDKKRREYILYANIWKVILSICLPLAAYGALNNLFKVVDNIMASHVSSRSVSAVAYITQIYAMLASIGSGLSVGGSINISRSYGAGNYALLKKQVNTLFACSTFLSVAVVLLIPFTDAFLRLNGTPEILIAEGRGYFAFTLLDMAVGFFNNVYICVERARGNSRRILMLNFISIAVKLSSTAFFVYVMDYGITMIGFAGVLANLTILFAALFFLRNKEDAFGLDRKSVSFTMSVIRPVFKLGIPVMIEKFSFSLGRVIINAMSTVYGALTVGALGVSNNLSSMTVSFSGGFQDGCSSIISQNIGGGNTGRAVKAFKVTLCINIIVCGIGMVTTLFLLKPLADLFASGDEYFAGIIRTIYSYEAYTAIPLGINHAVMGMLYGFGFTKITLAINFCRLFIYRIPVLWALQQFTSLGSESVGMVQMISNMLTGLTSLIVALIILRKILHKNNSSFQAS